MNTWMTNPLFTRQNGHVYYYQNDHLGTSKRLITKSGQVVWQAEHQSFGEAEVTLQTVSNNLRPPGQYYDDN